MSAISVTSVNVPTAASMSAQVSARPAKVAGDNLPQPAGQSKNAREIKQAEKPDMLAQLKAIEAQIAYQNAEAQAALANYGKVVLNAFGEVENALNGEMTWRERTIALQTQLKEQKQILRNTEQEFSIGRIDQRQIQQQKIKTNTTEINVRQGQVDALTQRVNLYLALGGSPTP